jgi:hypothetical protein
MIVMNNTFYGNSVWGGLGGSTNNGVDPGGNGGNGTSGGLAAGSNVTVTNNIFCADSAYGGTPGGGSVQGTMGNGTDGALTSFEGSNLSYNLFYGNVAVVDADGGTLGSNNVFARQSTLHRSI